MRDYSHLRDQFTAVFGFDFLKKTRKREYVEARSAFYHYLYTYEKLTLNDVGDVINLQTNWKPTHASILNCLKNYDIYSFYNPKVSEAVALVLGLGGDKLTNKIDFIKVAIDHCSSYVIDNVHIAVTNSYEHERRKQLEEERELELEEAQQNN